ncbi:MAG: reverse transcriptase domain-containing protein [Candidatus Peregrinibacteria bacterium]
MSLENLWETWLNFRKGKKPTPELYELQYNLERNLFKLHKELNSRMYRHGQYRTFTVCDNKKRVISVAPIRDRIVHRLIYDYLVPIYDRTFIFDAWSCRKGKGLLACIKRAQNFLSAHPRSFVWRADIRKFFDSVNHDTLLAILVRRVHDPKAIWLIREIINSFSTAHRGGQAQRERESL